MERCDNCLKEIAEDKVGTHLGYCRRNIKRCPTCGEMFDINFTEEHQEQFHSKAKCEHCRKQFGKAEIEKHRQNCSQKPKFCEYCQLNVPIAEFTAHLRQCESRTKHCEKCNKAIVNKEYLIHITTCQGIVEEQPKSRNYGDHISQQRMKMNEKKSEYPDSYRLHEEKKANEDPRRKNYEEPRRKVEEKWNAKEYQYYPEKRQVDHFDKYNLSNAPSRGNYGQNAIGSSKGKAVQPSSKYDRESGITEPRETGTNGAIRTRVSGASGVSGPTGGRVAGTTGVSGPTGGRVAGTTGVIGSTGGRIAGNTGVSGLTGTRVAGNTGISTVIGARGSGAERNAGKVAKQVPTNNYGLEERHKANQRDPYQANSQYRSKHIAEDSNKEYPRQGKQKYGRPDEPKSPSYPTYHQTGSRGIAPSTNSRGSLDSRKKPEKPPGRRSEKEWDSHFTNQIEYPEIQAYDPAHYQQEITPNLGFENEDEQMQKAIIESMGYNLPKPSKSKLPPQLQDDNIMQQSFYNDLDVEKQQAIFEQVKSKNRKKY